MTDFIYLFHRSVTILLQIGLLAISLLFACFILLGQSTFGPISFAVTDKMILSGLFLFFTSSIFHNALNVYVNLTSVSPGTCDLVMRVLVWIWSAYNGGLYIVLFSKWKGTDMNESYTIRDKLVLLTIAGYPTFVGAFFFFVSEGYMIGEPGLKTCLFDSPLAAYILAAVADTGFSSILLYLFLRPLQELKGNVASSTMSVKFKAVVKRNMIAGCVAIASTFVAMILGIIQKFVDSEFFSSLFNPIVTLDMYVNVWAVMYSMMPAWKWRSNGNRVFGGKKKEMPQARPV